MQYPSSVKKKRSVSLYRNLMLIPLIKKYDLFTFPRNFVKTLQKNKVKLIYPSLNVNEQKWRIFFQTKPLLENISSIVVNFCNLIKKYTKSKIYRICNN